MKIEFNTRSLLSVFFRQCLTFIVVFALTASAGLTYLLLTTPQYMAAGSLLVRFGKDVTAEITGQNTGIQIISQNDRREIMQSNMDILQSNRLLLSVVREVGAEHMYPGITERAVASGELPEQAAVIKLLKGDLIVKSSQQSNIINVQLTNEDPKLAARFVRRLFKSFIARQSDVYNKPQVDFLKEQLKQASDKLERSQEALEEFKNKTGISSLETELESLLRQRGDTGVASLNTLDDAWEKLGDLQEEERQLLATYRADSPQVRRVHQRVVLAQQMLAKRQASLDSRTGKASSKIDKRIAELESQRKKYNDLVRQVEIDEENYKNYKTKSEDAIVNQTINQQNISPISIVDNPVTPRRPIHPRKLLILAMTLLSAFVLALLAILIREVLDPRITTPAQVEYALGIPVLASFSAQAGEGT